VAKETLISYEPTDANGVLSASLEGELDLDTADRVRDELIAVAGGAGCRFLQVDVAGLTFIDSYALGALVSARNGATAAGVTMTLRNPSTPVLKAIQVTGLADVFGL
jgi:anti-sigma B factor antagonist